MKYTTAAVLLGSAATGVSAGYCANAINDGGNYYCPDPVKQIKYSGLDIPGTYQKVTSMNADGTCSFAAQAYSGSMAPFDEGLSVHLRGPIQVSNFAVYTPGKTTTKREAQKTGHSKRHHGHQHLHKKHHEEKRDVGDMVTATIDGKVVSWVNTWAGATQAAAPAPAATTAAASPAGTTPAPVASSGSDSSSPASDPSDDIPVATGDYVRSAYYSASKGIADGLTFLAQLGDSKTSGVWDTTWGNSLSYVSEDGKSVAASPTVLGNILLEDAQEISIFSDKPCDASCGTVREGATNYKGFEGAAKVFVMEFTMPLTGKRDWLGDMGAVWLLNSQIPRTQQYGACSCWGNTGGCGEFDIFEILAPGDTRAKSTFHFANGVGDSHFFERPTEAPITVAVVMDTASNTAVIKVLDSFDFGTSLSPPTLQSMIVDEVESLFSLMDFVA